MNRDEMVAEATALGINFRSTLSDEKLAERIALVKAAQDGDESLDLPEGSDVIPDPVPEPIDPATAHEPTEAQDPEPDDDRQRKNARVLWANVHSRDGKHAKGDEYMFLEDDFETLDGLDAIKAIA